MAGATLSTKMIVVKRGCEPCLTLDYRSDCSCNLRMISVYCAQVVELGHRAVLGNLVYMKATYGYKPEATLL